MKNLYINSDTYYLYTPRSHTKFRSPGMGSLMCHAPPNLEPDSNFVLKTYQFLSSAVFLEGHVTSPYFDIHTPRYPLPTDKISVS